MTPDEIRVRSTYLYLACAQAVDQVAGRLASTLPPSTPPASGALLRSLRRELGLLFRYWTTRQIWRQLEAEEVDAKDMNVALLRLFVDGFKLPRDGSGLKYAELSTAADELHELSHRITNAIGQERRELLAELPGVILPWRDAIATYTSEAVALPLDQITGRVRELAGRLPGEPGPGTT